MEGRFEHQVFGRIARHIQLGEHDKVRTHAGGFGPHGAALSILPINIAHDRVGLSDSNCK
jgi:hypothetical protein